MLIHRSFLETFPSSMISSYGTPELLVREKIEVLVRLLHSMRRGSVKGCGAGLRSVNVPLLVCCQSIVRRIENGDTLRRNSSRKVGYCTLNGSLGFESPVMYCCGMIRTLVTAAFDPSSVLSMRIVRLP